MQHANHIIFYMLIADTGNYVHTYTCYIQNPELSLKCLELFYKKHTFGVTRHLIALATETLGL